MYVEMNRLNPNLTSSGLSILYSKRRKCCGWRCESRIIIIDVINSQSQRSSTCLAIIVVISGNTDYGSTISRFVLFYFFRLSKKVFCLVQLKRIVRFLSKQSKTAKCGYLYSQNHDMLCF